MEAAAQDRYRSKIKELEKSLAGYADTPERIATGQSKAPVSRNLSFRRNSRPRLTKFKQKQAEANKELKQVRKDLRREVDSLENRIKWFNIAGMPLLVTVAGISLAIVKRKKTAAR